MKTESQHETVNLIRQMSLPPYPHTHLPGCLVEVGRPVCWRGQRPVWPRWHNQELPGWPECRPSELSSYLERSCPPGDRFTIKDISVIKHPEAKRSVRILTESPHRAFISWLSHESGNRRHANARQKPAETSKYWKADLYRQREELQKHCPLK